MRSVLAAGLIAGHFLGLSVALRAEEPVGAAVAQSLNVPLPDPVPELIATQSQTNAPANVAEQPAKPQSESEAPAKLAIAPPMPQPETPPAIEDKAAALLSLPLPPDVEVVVAPPVDPLTTGAVKLDLPPAPAIEAQPEPTMPAAKPPVIASKPETPPAQATEAAETRIPAEAIEKALAEKRNRSALPPKQFDALAAFYAKRSNLPLWFEDGAWSKSAKAAAKRLERAGEDGLVAARYAVALKPGKDAAVLAAADIELSEAAILYARDASGARIDPQRVSALITAKPAIPEADDILAGLIDSSDADAYLADFNPPLAGYKALRQKLAELRKSAPAPVAAPIRIPPGKTLKVGMNDERVPLLRRRLDLAASEDTLFDQSLSDAVAAFQRKNDLAATGHLNRATTAALSGEAAAPGASEAEIIANMERWRWLPRDLGERYVIVNIADFSLRVMEHGAAIHQARVIVGKPVSQTPVFSEQMQFLVVNPSWTVPPSILKKEFLPAMAADPDYAAKRGYEVIRNGRNITIRQPPGERNALGHIKFMFPNRHAVYIHDTPNRNLFGAASRAYSHGCVRVQDPFRLAEVIFGPASDMNAARLRAMIGKGERQVKLQQPLPVHLTYFTQFVDENGQLQSRNDLYGHSARLRALLGLS